jgi:hypothetical protein
MPGGFGGPGQQPQGYGGFSQQGGQGYGAYVPPQRVKRAE